ncbi:Cyclic di-GMP phosphodiesterase Gmr [Marinomonas aquimarina]|uniref:Cyclic di-GMP phosphodiesterase Gmr n=1 Tax=Marinomonas aquimarina TaxID=295068 RepID=A0A1A8TAH2_9GAMM|nr:diguanylate cyclase [Marinomonas aquimarina]SBS28497.1 Cyclic di-GMP phosphodiesterase Gmr [Marinomonas aquimarina]
MSWRNNKTNPYLTYAVILFFIFDGTALGLNIWLTQRVQNQTIELNLAGRQRMLSQKMVKEFLYAPPGAATPDLREKLSQTVNLFDRTLNAFRMGGTTLDTDGNLVTLNTFNNRHYFELVEKAWGTWVPMRQDLNNYTKTPTAELFLRINQRLDAQSTLLLNYMNELALAIETQARYETGQIRLLQTIALILGMLNFVAAFWLYRLRLQALEQEQSLIDSLLNSMPSAMVFTDDQGHLIQANPKFTALLGLDLDSAAQHKIEDLIIPYPDKQGIWQLSFLATHRAIVKVEKTSAYQDDKHLIVWRIEDVSEDFAEREQLSSLAYKDPLTGLDNRMAFEEHFNQQNQLACSDHLYALMFLDLNNFKQINDTFGHNKGDMILREVGFRLKQFVSDSFHIARYGGDEFILLLQNIRDEESAIAKAEYLVESLKAPYYVGSEILYIDASIGITTFTGKQSNTTKIISKADKAMYQAKKNHNGHNVHLIQWEG